MTSQVQKRRGTTTEHSTFTGAEGEITVDTSKDTAVVHDGVTAGGKPLAREDLSNVSASTVAAKLNGTAVSGVDINSGAIDGTTIGATSPSTGAFTSLSATGNIAVSGTVDGRDVAADGAKLDGIEAGADVTDTANVTAAGALMDSELTDITAVKAINQGLATSDSPSFASIFSNGAIFSNGGTSYGNIEVGGDLGGIIDLKAPNSDDFDARIAYYNGSSFRLDTNADEPIILSHDSLEKFRTSSTGVTVTGNISVTGGVDGRDIATDGAKLDGIESGADVTDTLNVTAAGALMDSELTNITAVKALNQGVSTSDSPSFSGLSSDATYSAASAGDIPSVLAYGAYGGGIGLNDSNVLSGFYATDTGTKLHLFTGQTSADTAADKLVMSATSAGHVGIGTSSPSTVSGYKSLNVKSTNGGELQLGNTAGTAQATIWCDSNGVTYNNHGSTEHAWTIGGSEVMSLNANGDISANSLSVTGSLNANAVVAADAGYGYLELGGDSGAIIDLKAPNSLDYETRIVHQGNDFTIQTDSGSAIYKSNGYTTVQAGSSYPVIIKGYNTTICEFNNNGANLSGAGVSYATPAGVFGRGSNKIGFGWSSPNIYGFVDNAVEAVIGTVSDYRLKDNITDYSDDALNIIANLRTVTYNPKDSLTGETNIDETYIGFIAHEVQEIIPSVVTGTKDAVSVDGDPRYQSVNYAGVVPVLVEAIKELSAKNKELEARLEALEA